MYPFSVLSALLRGQKLSIVALSLAWAGKHKVHSIGVWAESPSPKSPSSCNCLDHNCLEIGIGKNGVRGRNIYWVSKFDLRKAENNLVFLGQAALRSSVLNALLAPTALTCTYPGYMVVVGATNVAERKLDRESYIGYMGSCHKELWPGGVKVVFCPLLWPSKREQCETNL